MTRLHPIGDTLQRHERLLDVVFVHGAGGHHLNSWGMRREEEGGEKDSMLHWLLTDEKLSDIGVWSLQHESDKFWAGSQGSLVRDELVRNLLQEMMQNAHFLKGLPGKDRRPICWIAHSEGGNVVKQFLQYCQLQRDGNLQRAKSADALLDATVSVYFIDTPHRGSWVARFPIPFLRRRERVRELREAEPGLINLDTWYVDTMDGKIKSLNFYQAGERFKVVGTASARLNRANEIAIDKNHNRIATPASRDEPPYRQIYLDLLEIRADVLQRSLPVPAAPLRLERGGVMFAGEPLRLLCFVEPELTAYNPASLGRQETKQFRVKFWLSEGDGVPAKLEQAWVEALSAQQLADQIAAVYSDQLNESPDGRLLVSLFLPHQDLIDDGLPHFLLQLQKCARQCLPNSTGIPLFLACSSRWAVGSSAHPILSKTRSDLRKASDRLIRTWFRDSTPGNDSLGCLNWLMIDVSPSVPLQSVADAMQMPTPRAFDSIVEGKVVFREKTLGSTVDGDQPLDEEDAIDLLSNRIAVYLSNRSKLSQAKEALNPIDQLVMRGIPLIWCDNTQVLGGDQQGHIGGFSTHPMDSILTWDGLTFLSNIYHFQHEKPAAEDMPNLPLRQFVRKSIIFWEDHRHIPTEATSKLSASTMAVSRFQVPFRQ